MADVSRRVSLIFEADTSAAKNSINELVKSLQSIQSKPTDLVNTDSIKTASKAALELQEHLRKAVNVDTGKLDLSRFVTSLNSSKKTLEDYRVALNRIGPEGNRAFIQLAHNINNSETSTVRLNKTMQNFLNTLKNTVKWQISSNITHGLESTISHAYNYAKQLDGVLNDIRIVSGKSAEEMANFAVAANRSAQELSTTTSKYAEASLIFFQQGLSDAAVKERTDTVIKMANITGEAMTDVSSYMTAIWNNFADGTKNLEYYADVIVKLGADTASSSEEIAGGLEKFIAIGDQIGLSYEYAAAALTTITAQTRQSEDVVGTALRTIFARIQGLSLGETLDDGTTLNKYSSALQKVGVNIKDASGQLKDMDVILDDLGSKWGTLGRDTQIALAQTVGGVRQYNQIIALMDNWEFFQKNLQTAYSSEGSVEKQTAIYEESWRAAENRVKAAAEGIYDALLDEKIFIQLDGFFTKILNTVQGVVEGMGGMVPILATIGGFIATRFAKEVPVMISNFKENLAIFSGKSGTKALEEQSKLTENLQKKLRAAKPGTEEAAELTSLERVSRMREELLKNQKNMNSAQIEEYENLIKVEQTIGRINTERAKGIEQSKLQAQESASLLEDEISLFGVSEVSSLSNISDEDLLERAKKVIKADKGDFGIPIDDESLLSYMKNSNFDDEDLNAIGRLSVTGKENLEALKKQYNTNDLFSTNLKKQSDEMLKYAKASGEVSAELTKLKNLQKNVFNNKDLKPAEQTELSIKGIKQALQELKNTAEDSGEKISFLDGIENDLKEIENNADAPADKLKKLQDLMDQLNIAAENYRGTMSKKSNEASENLIAAGVDAKIVQQAKADAHIAGIKGQAYPVETGENTLIEEPKIEPTTKSEAFTTLAATAMEAYGAIQAVQSAWETFNDVDASGLEKIGAAIGTIVSLTMALNGVVSLANVLSKTAMFNSIQTASAKLGESAANNILAKAINKVAAANAKLMASNPVGWVIGAIAIIGGLTAAFIALANRESEEEKRLRLLKEESEALAIAQENLERKISDVNSAWDNYDQTVQALKECTAGTEEWTNALLETNQAVLSLLAVSPELSEYIGYGPNGELKLVGITAEDYVAQLNKRNAALQAQSLIVDAQISNTELENLYGNEQQLLQVQRLWATLPKESYYRGVSVIDGESTYDTDILAKETNNIANFLEELYTIFEGDEEGFTQFVADSNLSLIVGRRDNDYAPNSLEPYNLYSDIETWGLDGYMNAGGEIALGFASIPTEVLSLWQEALDQKSINDKTIETAYTALMGSVDGYIQDYVGAYGVIVERNIQEIQSATDWYWGTADIDELARKNQELFGGEIEDYKELGQEVLRRRIAFSEFVNNSENLIKVVDEIGNQINDSTEFGKEVLQAQGEGAYIRTGVDLSGLRTTPGELFEISDDELAAKNNIIEQQEEIGNITSDLQSYIFDNYDKTSETYLAYRDIQSIILGFQLDLTKTGYNSIDAIQSELDKAEEEEESLNNEAEELTRRLEELRAKEDKLINGAIEANANTLNSALDKLLITDENIEGFYTPESLYGTLLEGTYDFNNYEGILTDEEILAMNNASPSIINSITGERNIPENFYVSNEGIIDTELSVIQEEIAITEELLERNKSRREEIEGVITALEEAETEYSGLESQFNAERSNLSEAREQLNKETEQTILDELIGEIEESGIDIVDGFLTITEDFRLEDALNVLEQRLNQELSNSTDAIHRVLTEYFNGLGLTLEEFLAQHTEYTEESLYEAMTTMKPDSQVYKDIQVDQFIKDYELDRDLGQEEILELGTEYAAREQLYTVLLNTEVRTEDIKSDAYLEQIKSIYGLVGETGQEILDNLYASIEVSRTMAASTWNTAMKGYGVITYDSEADQFAYEGNNLVGIGAAISREEGIEPSEINALTQLYSDLESSSSKEAFSNFDNLLAKMISSGEDIGTIINVINASREKMLSLGRELTTDELADILEENDTSAGKLNVSLEDLTISLGNTISASIYAANAFDNLTASLSAIKSGLSDIQEGTIFDEEEWNELKSYIPEEYRDLFMSTAEGGAVFAGTDEQGRTLSQEALLATGTNFYERTRQVQEYGATFSSNSGLGENITLENVQTLLETFNPEEDTDLSNLITALGYDTDEEYVTEDEDGNKSLTEAGTTIANAILSVLTGEYINLDEASEVLATSGYDARGIATLQDKGILSEEDAEYASRIAFQEEVTDLGLDVDEVDALGDSIQDLAEDSEELADSLKDDANAADEIAKELKRYDKAVESVTENYDDWNKALKSNNISEQSDAINEMDKAYSDLLDLDYDSLSNDFLTNSENLKLLQEAANGSEEAYQSLQEAAGKDILAQIGIDTQQFDVDKAAIDNALIEIEGKTLDDIEVGAELNDAGFLQGLTDMVNAAGMTADQATAYLSSMGIDAEVITDTTKTVDNVKYMGAIPNVQAVTFEGTTPVFGLPQSYSFPSVTYKPAPVEIPSDKENTAFALKVTSANKSSGGGFKHKNSNSSGRRTGGGGGGGGGGSRAPRAERKTSTDKDRYRTVKNQLEDLTDSYDKVSTAADRAFGETKLELLKQQEKAIQDLISKQREYIDEINEYYDIDRKAVEEVSSRLGFAVEFDANGTITNWDEIQNQMIEEYNSHINDKGEVIGMDEDAWSEYEKEWERIMELFNQYDETQDLRKEALQQLQDYANQLYDLQLQEVTYVVEIKIDATDDALEILDYMLERIEDDAWAAAEAIAYMGQKAAEIQLQNNTYTEGIRGILMNHTRDLVDSEGNIVNSASLTVEDVEGFMSGQEAAIKKIMALNEEFTDEEVQQLREYNSSLIEMNETLNELRNEVFDKVLDSFEAFNDEMDRSIDKIDHLSSLTENYANIIDIVGQKNLEISNALMESISQATVDQATNRVEATREKMLTIQDEIARAEEALADAKSKGLEEDVKLWEDTLKEMNDSLDEAEEEFLQSWEDALTAAADAFEASMDRAISAFGDALAGPLLGSLEQLEEMFDRQNTIADRYLPDYEKIYELNKLNRDITNSIDETDNIRAKQELAALQEEINKLEEDGVQVSEYQVENLRRRYELKLAELALTESQNAKSEVRMTRNADGDWSYVYVADEEQVAEAEQNYEDKLFAMQQANAEYINNLNDMLIQLRVNTFNSLQEIWEDETLSQEEKIAKTNELFAYAQEQMEYYMDELGLVLGENQILYEQDWAKYSELTGYKISANEDYVDHFNETALSLLTGYETMEEFQQNFNDAIGHPDSGGFLYDLDNAFKTWEANTNTEEIFNSAGTSMEDFKDVVEDSVNDIVENSDEAAESIEEMGDTVVSTFDEITSAVQNWSNVYSETIDSILARNEMLAKSFNELLKAWAGFEEATEVEEGTAPGEDEEVDTGDLEGGDGQTEEDKGKIQDGDAVYIAEGTPGIADWAEGPGRRYYAFYRNNAGKRAVGSGVWYVTVDPKNKKWDGYIGRIHEKYLRKFDTGGYTGSWGAEGRVAMLHEKELVLNKQDTSNLLAAVGMIRDISKIINLNAYASSYGNIASTPNVVDNTGTLEQQVHITAGTTSSYNC